MRTKSLPGWFDYDVRVNGMEFPEVSLRSSDRYRSCIEILIRDRHLGPLALTEEFRLEARAFREGRIDWESVTLMELTQEVIKHAQNLGIEPLEPAKDLPSLTPGSEPVIPGYLGRIPVEGDTSHLDRAEEALRRAGLSFELIGGRCGHGRNVGHLTIAVSSLERAGTRLARAGFLESAESRLVFLDSRTGWKIRLLKT